MKLVESAFTYFVVTALYSEEKAGGESLVKWIKRLVWSGLTTMTYSADPMFSDVDDQAAVV